MQSLVQKRGRDYRKFDPHENGLTVESCIGGRIDFFIHKYEDLEFDEVVTIRKPSLHKILLLLSVFLNLILLLAIMAPLIIKLSENSYILIIPAISILTFIFLWGTYIFKYRFEKSLSGSMKIIFFYHMKQRQQVDSFITLLKKKQRDYMRKKYMRLDEFSSPDQQERVFMWLYNRNFITRSELELLMEETTRIRINKRD
jgi:predicted membrane metal-binding protein